MSYGHYLTLYEGFEAYDNWCGDKLKIRFFPIKESNLPILLSHDFLNMYYIPSIEKKISYPDSEGDESHNEAIFFVLSKPTKTYFFNGDNRIPPHHCMNSSVICCVITGIFISYRLSCSKTRYLIDTIVFFHDKERYMFIADENTLISTNKEEIYKKVVDFKKEMIIKYQEHILESISNLDIVEPGYESLRCERIDYQEDGPVDEIYGGEIGDEIEILGQ